MTGFSQLNHKAIAWYSEKNDCVPQLSAWPIIRFLRKIDGGEVTFNIADLTIMFDSDRKEASKERARLKRQQEGGRR